MNMVKNLAPRHVYNSLSEQIAEIEMRLHPIVVERSRTYPYELRPPQVTQQERRCAIALELKGLQLHFVRWLITPLTMWTMSPHEETEQELIIQSIHTKGA